MSALQPIFKQVRLSIGLFFYKAVLGFRIRPCRTDHFLSIVFFVIGCFVIKCGLILIYGSFAKTLVLRSLLTYRSLIYSRVGVFVGSVGEKFLSIDFQNYLATTILAKTVWDTSLTPSPFWQKIV